MGQITQLGTPVSLVLHPALRGYFISLRSLA